MSKVHGIVGVNVRMHFDLYFSDFSVSQSLSLSFSLCVGVSV